jgi:hypothetical protein
MLDYILKRYLKAWTDNASFIILKLFDVYNCHAVQIFSYSEADSMSKDMLQRHIKLYLC